MGSEDAACTTWHIRCQASGPPFPPCRAAVRATASCLVHCNRLQTYSPPARSSSTSWRGGKELLEAARAWAACPVRHCSGGMATAHVHACWVCLAAHCCACMLGVFGCPLLCMACAARLHCAPCFLHRHVAAVLRALRSPRWCWARVAPLQLFIPGPSHLSHLLRWLGCLRARRPVRARKPRLRGAGRPGSTGRQRAGDRARAEQCSEQLGTAACSGQQGGRGMWRLHARVACSGRAPISEQQGLCRCELAAGLPCAQRAGR